jgi:hypothetical protein
MADMALAGTNFEYRAVPMIVTLPAVGTLSLQDDLTLRGLMSELVQMQDMLPAADPHWVHMNNFSAKMQYLRQWLMNHHVAQYCHIIVYAPQASLATLVGPDITHRGPAGPAVALQSTMPTMHAGPAADINFSPAAAAAAAAAAAPTPADLPTMHFTPPVGLPRPHGAVPFCPPALGMFPSTPLLRVPLLRAPMPRAFRPVLPERPIWHPRD